MKNTIKTKYELFKQNAYVIIYGTNTFLGVLFDILLLVFICISVLLVMLESVQNIDVKYHLLLVVLEWGITLFFTAEYILRIITHKRPIQYIFSFYGIIDLISILPMYLSFFIEGSKVLSTIRILRLLRIFRILSLVKFSSQANELKEAIRASRAKIMVFIYFMLLICILLGAFMYMIESPSESFSSIPVSIYWCVVTLTTVGYGDIAPATTLGQIVASIIMILGYGIIAVPTGIVSSEYSQLNKKRRSEQEKTLTQQAERMCGSCGHTHFPENSKFCHLCGAVL